MLYKGDKEQRMVLFLGAAALITLGRAIAGKPFDSKKIADDARDLTQDVMQEIKHIEQTR